MQAVRSYGRKTPVPLRVQCTEERTRPSGSKSGDGNGDEDGSGSRSADGIGDGNGGKNREKGRRGRKLGNPLYNTIDNESVTDVWRTAHQLKVDVFMCLFPYLAALDILFKVRTAGVGMRRCNYSSEN